MSHLRRRLSGTVSVRVVVLALGAGLLLAGCSDDDPADPEGSPETTSEGTPSPTGETSPTESEPTDDPSVDPATGPVLTPETGGIRVRMPEGWTLDENQASFLVNGSEPRGRGRIFVSSFPSLNRDASLQDLARVSIGNGGFPPGSIRPPVTVSGRRAFHLVGRVGSTPSEEFGALVDGDILTVRFDLMGVPEDERQPLIESVLATVEWG
jgi:hypothetical protein